ncbi:GntR family transcriptional regulator, arabinose operon transcriptional repressor [Gracilibacillus ureilyticus]|uniref:GntR family transcriptional regulator, arabinose operon transcriptional repressor n=1 Tax=Gracilibacillus ureilyticus TaxID=531814 RepID=A0A1H9MXP8_9BACI|nr:GntR family transcriptional regulator [Gracilibacillus ureilyticus]SER28239.1 GntR family transcriptional regulator, arabinose operon transcriptional repressor [Gracilibacillus ureilyticus]
MQTKYNIVKQAIKSQILDGTYQPHQKISSESELMKQFGVSRHTVRLAIGDLVNQGWLYREQGAGTFCADRSKEDNLQQVRQKNIAIITTYISDYIFPSIIRGAESYLSQRGYQVSLFSTNNDHENERKFLEKILTQQFDGVIIEPTKSAVSNPNINYYLNLERQNIPYLMINAFYDELEPFHIVMDEEKGGFLQTEHLIELGHKNIIGFFKNDDIQGTKRMKGYLKAHRKHNIEISPNNIVTYTTEEKLTKPVEVLKKLLFENSESRPTGIVCYNDELAINLLDVIRESQLNIPEDLSIVGFDDSFMAEITEVKLTTIKHPQSEMGELAAKVILDMIKQSKGSKKQTITEKDLIRFDPELVVRSSTAEVK